MGNLQLPVKMGRPTKYRKDFPNRAITYIKNSLKKKEIPTIQAFAISLGVSERAIHGWKREYEDFLQSMELLETAQKGMLLTGGLQGSFNPRFASFVLGASHGMSDKQPIVKNTQNNIFEGVSPELLADAIKLMRENDKALAEKNEAIMAKEEGELS